MKQKFVEENIDDLYDKIVKTEKYLHYLKTKYIGSFNKHNTANQMAILARKIKIVVKVHNTLFPADPLKGLSNDELDFLVDCI